MRRPARRLFTLCSAVSLLLCVAVCVLWVRSYYAYEGGNFGCRGALHTVYHFEGAIRYRYNDIDPKPWVRGFESLKAPWFFDAYGDPIDAHGEWNVDLDYDFLFGHVGFQRAGFIVARGETRFGVDVVDTVIVQVPYAALAVVFSMWPAVRLARFVRRRQRHRRGRCPS